MKLLFLPCLGSVILSGCQASFNAAEPSELAQWDKTPGSTNPRVGDARWTADDKSLTLPKLTATESPARIDRIKKTKSSLKQKKNDKLSSKKWKYETKYDGSDTRHHRARREISDNQVDGDFARVLDRVITLAAPKARSRLQTLWKRLRSVLFNTKGDGSNGERADELTKALFQQLFKQFDLPTVLRKRADKLRRRVGPSGPAQPANSTDSLKKDDAVRVVDFRKKGEESKSGDDQIQQWLGMVADGDKNLAQKEKVDVVGEPTTTTTVAPTSSTRYPQLSLFQRRKGPVQVAVKVPQKHAKSGIKRFSPAQGRKLSSRSSE